jgi:hypothetical protein
MKRQMRQQEVQEPSGTLAIEILSLTATVSNFSLTE